MYQMVREMKNMARKKSGKVSKAQEQEQIVHPHIDLETLKSKGVKVSKKPKSYAKDRIVKLLIANPDGLTQGTIHTLTGMREQHINNIVRKLEETGDIERYMIKTQVGGKLKELIYNVFVGSPDKFNLD